MLETAIEAARRAGEAIAQRYPTDREVTVKGYRDIVTEVDYVAERIVLDTIRSRFPDHTIVSEEAGTIQTDSRYRWIIDPIDGTTNFSRRLPFFAVSVGLLYDEEPLAGAIYDPLRDDMFTALTGQGAHLNGTSIAAGRAASLDDAIVAFDWGHADAVREATLHYVGQVGPLCRTVRGLGSATLGLAYVAAGWIDAYLNLAMKPWDTAAGMVLVREAGGAITTPAGTEHRFDSPACLATNGRIHGELLALLRSTPKCWSAPEDP
jgi:myo-inositol-1(or 4)-monophosphatase